MSQYILHFPAIDKSSLAAVGGKGANLGELSRLPAMKVPPGFCVTTDAYRAFTGACREFPSLLAALAAPEASPSGLKAAGERLRARLEAQAIPPDLAAAILKAWRDTGEASAYAVRSSATAEDLPGASFAGQQDTYLNISGEAALLDAVRRCWASLFTERAIAYRRQNGFDHAHVFLSVVVQRMIFPQVAGILFTADPVSGNRRVTAIDASFGLGEALVSGLVSADLYHVKDDEIVKKQIARKLVAIYAEPAGGTRQVAIEDTGQTAPSLTDGEAVRLARLGRTIERHFGPPQDIEWAIDNGEIFILQSRPITTLYPVPAVADGKSHLFLSLGHQQMMTEAMKPLGLSVLRTLAPFGKSSPAAESRLLLEAGSRLYADVTPLLAYGKARRALPAALVIIDEAMARAVGEFVGRAEAAHTLPSPKTLDISLLRRAFPLALDIFQNIAYRDDSRAIEKINAFVAASVADARKRLAAKAGAARIAAIQEVLAGLLPAALDAWPQYMGAALLTYKRIESLSRRWLGDAAELAGLSKAPAGNVTTEMGLQLGDLADAIRSRPAVVDYLRRAGDAGFWEGLAAVAGGREVLPAFRRFFERYGMRGTGEIDITRLRWREAPTQLLGPLLSHLQNPHPGQHRRDFLAGQADAERAAERLLARLSRTAGGFLRVRRMQRLIKVYRSLIGMREHPKYFIVQHLDLVKQALLAEAADLTADGVLTSPDDIFWFTLPEIKAIVETRRADLRMIDERREKFGRDARLTPPRAMTGEGEIITVRPTAAAPPGALAGSPVSAGRVEGRAHVVRSLEEAHLERGDILVTAYTDPAWTPLFPVAAGLVTEVGGLMTHGAVVAREYGIPAVVGVDGATARIRDGQIIRVDGTQGFVEIIG